MEESNRSVALQHVGGLPGGPLQLGQHVGGAGGGVCCQAWVAVATDFGAPPPALVSINCIFG